MITYMANPVRDAREAFAANQLGIIITPKQGNKLENHPPTHWCIDNGCGPSMSGTVGAGYPGDQGFLALLAKLADNQARCLFAVAPDVVGDARATLARSAPMLPQIRALGYQAAFVAQNGQESLPVPWDTFDVLFLGGTPECRPCGYVRPADDLKTKACPFCSAKLAEWKLSADAARLVDEAKAHGKKIHMGRVNSFKRLLIAASWGCDSADGTYLIFGARINLPKLLGWLTAIKAMPWLEDQA